MKQTITWNKDHKKVTKYIDIAFKNMHLNLRLRLKQYFICVLQLQTLKTIAQLFCN